MEEAKQQIKKNLAELQVYFGRADISTKGDFKGTKNQTNMKGGVSNFQFQEGREDTVFSPTEPWSPGIRNEHEMLGFHLHRF
ncbi:hypothetical protein QJS04_geneDACA010245 [Acorus gramineus]|uniref:Uncharacterized protein n=1 Tax=Acorus gramineus TaxID=55184 RepID=A0AAV9A6S8_ACOGR|nr:hypothetical protein QJS04_geneDACA010245 [Acorus gramineus]